MTHEKIVLTHGNMDKKMYCLDIIWLLYYNYLCAMNDSHEHIIEVENSGFAAYRICHAIILYQC